MSSAKTVYVLDSHGLLYQLFHALPPMSSPKGEPVNAVYGFTREIFNLLEKQKPDYLFCAFDQHAPTFRTSLYEPYKANRRAMPDDLRPQIAAAKEVLNAFNVPILALDGFEADDILATVAQHSQNSPPADTALTCVIVSSDKDCRQLIRENVFLYSPRKGAFYKDNDLLADWGITPQQVIDFQSLVGDATDNVPGAAKIGAKTATELLQQFGSLEGIYENINKVSGKKKEYLLAGKDSVFLSRQLVTLKNDVPIQLEWNPYGGCDADQLRELFHRFGFKSLLDKVRDEGLELRDERQETRDEKLKPPAYILVDTPELFDTFFEQLSQQNEFALDTETVPMEPRFEATMPRYTHLAGLSFAWNDTEAYYLPLRGPLGANVLNAQLVLETLRPILENAAIGKTGQNIKYDAVVLCNVGVKLNGIVFDTMLADYILHSSELTHNLDDLAQRYLNHTTIKIEELIGTGKNQKRMDEVQPDVMAQYAGEDAWVTLRLCRAMRKEFIAGKSPRLDTLFQTELRLAEVLTEMEAAGISVDTPMLKALSTRFAGELAVLEREIYELAGHSFNVASPKQLAAVLFEELGLRTIRKTKTGQSTDIEVLEELAAEHPLPEKIVQHRQLAKLKGTYVDALPTLIHPVSQRIHTSFNQVATATGRLSSSNPNLQNIPVRSPEGKEIRSAFRAGAGFDVLLSCDYSQIELRVLAHFSQDETLCTAFRNGEDIHSRVAAELFGGDVDSVSSEHRRIAKAVNFGVIYGQTAFGLSKQLGIGQKEAQQFIDGYFRRYSGIQTYLDSVLDGILATGYAETLFGHRRYFHSDVIRRERKGALNQAERMAINTVIQGTAADLMKRAMVNLFSPVLRFDRMRANLLLQIHDELVFEVQSDYVQELRHIVTETMQRVETLRVPLVADAEVGEHW